MVLWLVGQLRGPEHARQVQQLLEYYPAPPYEDSNGVWNCFRLQSVPAFLLSKASVGPRASGEVARQQALARSG